MTAPPDPDSRSDFDITERSRQLATALGLTVPQLSRLLTEAFLAELAELAAARSAHESAA